MIAAAAFGTVALASVVIWKACDYFEAGSSYLGRNLRSGVRGATINAVGSSLPELLTTFALLFFFRDEDGFSAGIATCAGSAVFNAVIIPALVVLAVTWKNRVAPYITLDRAAVLRDGAFFILAEVVLIWFLSGSTMVWWMGGALLIVYGLYFGFMMYQVRTTATEEGSAEEQEMTSGRAWRLLAGSTAVIAVACYGLSWATVALAKAFDVPTYLTAVVFAAAATSVPDTVLSIKDALKGEYDDAVSNAIGSNIFDICVCLGVPLLVYGLVYGDVSLSSTAAGDAANVQTLRIGLIVVSVLVLGLLLWARRIKTRHGIGLLLLFVGWLGFLSFQGG